MTLLKFEPLTFLTKDTCILVGNQSGCTTDYSVSNVKIVDVWS